MNSQDAMKLLVTEDLQPLLASRGFRKRALTFFQRVDRNFVLLQLQKSVSSTAEQVRFTVNLGVFSARLQSGLGAVTWVPEVKAVPTEPDCHLRMRLGRLMTGGEDRWWSVDPGTDRRVLGGELRLLFERHAFPFLEACGSDEGLRDYRQYDVQERLGALASAVLQRDLGSREQAREILQRELATIGPGCEVYRSSVEALLLTCQPE